MRELPISVVMPVYNREKYVREAIESILNQTFTDFEFIIVNDGSTDGTEGIILSFKDPRIKYLSLEENSGNSVARNMGLKASRGKYIAIMDSDDISLPYRLKIQFDFMEKNPEIGIVSGYNIFFSEKEWFLMRYPADPAFIKSYLFFKNAVAQPSAFIRTSVLIKSNLYYNPEYFVAGDFDLWFRAAMSGIEISNLKQPLLLYRLSENQLTGEKYQAKRLIYTSIFFKEKLELLGIKPEAHEFKIFNSFVLGRILIFKEEFEIINCLLDEIQAANEVKNIFNILTFKAVLFSFRIRLLKYYLLEQRRPVQFSAAFINLLLKSGLNVFWCFWKNEGRFIRYKIHKYQDFNTLLKMKFNRQSLTDVRQP